MFSYASHSVIRAIQAATAHQGITCGPVQPRCFSTPVQEPSDIRNKFFTEVRALCAPTEKWAKLYKAEKWIDRFADCYTTDEDLRMLVDLDKEKGLNEVGLQLEREVHPRAGAVARDIVAMLKPMFNRPDVKLFRVLKDGNRKVWKVCSEADLENKLRKEQCSLELRADTSLDVQFEDIESEDEALLRSNDGIKYQLASSLLGTAIQNASRLTQAWTESLEAEFCSFMNRKLAVQQCSEGLFHQTHRWQVFLQHKTWQHPHERDGLFFSPSLDTVFLVSVKARFGTAEVNELKNDLMIAEEFCGDDWNMKLGDGSMVSFSKLYADSLQGRSCTFRNFVGIAVSPLFKPTIDMDQERIIFVERSPEHGHIDRSFNVRAFPRHINAVSDLLQ
eukprot:NODE_2606_length_1381_cov_109.314785_g2477_i0.p1 GENE.NODE_2606_length_1381_cov_109.314785_g2477_i0~~NODE_2606_length_1381_cov_109.314785_g2477_i0.p1  ORF type:complete len:390 (+),score=42.41 NODE_2606_length_1381_cov_109.314785_g2477_i0:75-1244(+)